MFFCDETLELEHWSLDSEPHDITPVYGGLRFRASGNYGSTIFDPMHCNDFLEIIICDNCVVKKKNMVQHIHDIIENKTSKTKQFDEKENKND